MGGAGVIQSSFTSGELSPSIYGRVDLSRYQKGLKTCNNFIVRQYGGVSNRQGTVLVNSVKTHSKRVRLIPFQFNTEQTYILEFGDLYMRVHKDVGTVMNGANPVEIVTPWSESDLTTLNYTQSADVMTICHQDHAPQTIGRISHTAWTIAAFSPQNGPFEEINVDEVKKITVSAATDSVTVTASGSGHAPFTSANVGDLIFLEQEAGYSTVVWEASKRIYNGDIVRSGGNSSKAVSANPGSAVPRITGSLKPSHTSGNAWDGSNTLDGSVYRPPATSTNVDAYVGVEWEYLHSGSGIVQVTAYTSTTVVTGTVLGYIPAGVVASGTYKWAFSAWSAKNGYPAATGYQNNRQVFGGVPELPQTVWMSCVSAYNDFKTSMPLLDDEAISFTLASREVNEVRHFLPLSELMVMTSGAEWIVKGDGDSAILPGSINAKLQGYGGASMVPPVIVGSTALYVHSKGQQVLAMSYSFEQDSFVGNDMTVLSSHLFNGRSVQEWAFQKVPFSVAWCVMDNGTLLGLTYLREQEVVGWHRHETDGLFESVASVTEGGEDAVYFAVNRTINGATKRYVERLATRQFTDTQDGVFVDSALSYDGRNATTTTMTLTGGTAWNQTETLTLTASAATFGAGDVGDEISYTLTDGHVYRLTITAYTSTTVVSVRPNQIIPAAYRTARTDWAFARNSFSGLSHLEAKTVSILADGKVSTQAVVASGAVALQRPAAVVHIGLPITATLETLPLSTQSANIRDRYKLCSKVSLLCDEATKVVAGPDTAHLQQYDRVDDPLYDPTTAESVHFFEVRTTATWEKNACVVVRHTDPTPLSILAVIPEVLLGGS